MKHGCEVNHVHYSYKIKKNLIKQLRGKADKGVYKIINGRK
jgi:hypothetical protein